MSDLVERLQGAYSTVFERSMAKEAADEIERLRVLINEKQDWIDRAVASCAKRGCSEKEHTATREQRERADQAEAALKECMAHADALSGALHCLRAHNKTIAVAQESFRKWKEKL